MKMILLILCLVTTLFTSGCFEDEKNNQQPQAPIIIDKIDATTKQKIDETSEQDKSWEKKELEKHNLSVNSTPAEIRANKNKPTMKEIFKWAE